MKPLKEKIVEVLKDFDNCLFCEDEGGFEWKVEIFLPKILQLVEEERQKWVENLLKKIEKVEEGGDPWKALSEIKEIIKTLNL
jgi:hypothetical protein